MTFGDADLLKKIADRFSEDSRHDSDLILAAIEEEDLTTLSLVLHRLAGRVGQIGAGELATEFRKMELAIAKKDGHLTVDERQQIKQLLEELKMVILAVKAHADTHYSIS